MPNRELLWETNTKPTVIAETYKIVRGIVDVNLGEETFYREHFPQEAYWFSFLK